MDVTCPACSARYRIPGSKVQGRTARMRCKACATEWLVSAEQREEPDAPTMAHVAPSSPSSPSSPPARAAVIRRGAERERRDLFATRSEEHAAPQSFRPLPPSYSHGTRNENSVLFTVDSLKKAVSSRPPAAPTGMAATDAPAWSASSVAASSFASAPAPDDEGIIDLKALSSLPPRGMVSVFPSEPSTGFARAVEVAKTGGHAAVAAHIMRRVNPRMAAAAMAAIATLLIASVGLAALFGGDVPHKLSASHPGDARVAAAAARLGTHLEEAAQAKLAVAAAAAKTETPAKVSSAPARRAKSVNGSPKSHGSVQTSAYVAPKPTKSTDTCGCKGDFNCILRCSAKGK